MKVSVAHSARREHGAALVVTLIVCTVLAMVVVAMMQNTTLDRASSAGVANQYRARLAADAGLAFAAASLSREMTNDHFIVVANANRQLFVGNGSNQPAGSFAYTPAFSTVNSVTSAVTPVVSNGIPATNLVTGPNTTNFIFTNLPGGLSVTSPPGIAWVYLTTTNSAGQLVTNARFAYWAEDLGGRLDLSVVGTNTAGRPTGTNPSEIALWSIFNPGASNDVGNAVAGALFSARVNLLTVATARLANTNVNPTNLADLASGLRHDTNEPEVIPFGFGYADQGRPKYNLNTNVSAGSLPNIVSVIGNNLRNPTNAALTFGSTNRSGGMAGDRYVNAIAASMIDYVDTNNIPTTGTVGGGAFRGIEGLPFVTETATAIQWMNHSTSILGFAPAWADEIHLENYVELWNPTDKEFSGVLDLTFSNRFHGGTKGGVPIDLSITNSNPGLFTVTNTSGRPVGQYQINVNPPLLPNEYRVFSLGTNIYRFKVANAGPMPAIYGVNNDRRANQNTSATHRFGPPGNNNGGPSFFGESLTMAFSGVVYDRIVDIERRSPRVTACEAFFASENPFWANNVAASRIYAGNLVSVAALPGDPRMGFYLTSTNAAQGYTNALPGNPGSSMGFRNDGRSSAGTNYITDPSSWLDAGFSNSPVNTNKITEADRPSTNRRTTNFSSEFVQRLNNSGLWTNILELGNIFDPMAWNVVTNTPSIIGTHTAAGNGTTTVTNGGGNTLRIGRAEHPRFTNDGLRAAQLLDLFAVGQTVGGVVVNRVPGRINLNTASTNVLRALAAGVQHTTETNMLPANLFVSTNAVGQFVNGVTNFRSQRPFFSASQLNLISTNTNPATWTNGTVFGRTNLLGVTNWGDRGAEEWFSRVYPLSTVRSRNFLVHVVGQSVATNNPTVPLSTARRVFQIYVEPMRAANGLTTNCTARILGTWDL